MCEVQGCPNTRICTWLRVCAHVSQSRLSKQPSFLTGNPGSTHTYTRSMWARPVAAQAVCEPLQMYTCAATQTALLLRHSGVFISFKSLSCHCCVMHSMTQALDKIFLLQSITCQNWPHARGLNLTVEETRTQMRTSVLWWTQAHRFIPLTVLNFPYPDVFLQQLRADKHNTSSREYWTLKKYINKLKSCQRLPFL